MLHLMPKSPPVGRVTTAAHRDGGNGDRRSLREYLGSAGRAQSTVLNLRAGPVRVEIGGRQVLRLAPLERREITSEEAQRIDFDKVRSSPWIKVDSVVGTGGWLQTLAPRAVGIAGRVAAAAALAAPVALLALTALGLISWSSTVWLAVTGLVAVAALVLAVVWIWARGQRAELVRLRRFVAHTTSKVAVVVVAVALPGAATWYLGGFRAPVGSVPQFDQFLSGPDNTALALAWLLLWIFISAAALLPALLFFLFDRTTLGTLQRELIFDVFRLEPRLATLSDLEAKYGPQIQEVYGSSPKRSGRLAAGTRAPVVLATVLLATGWTALMIHAGHGTAAERAGDGFRFIDFWQPPASLVGFAFLGAYVFGIRSALRGHLRGDLRAKSYSAMSVRLLVVVVLAWVLEASLPSAPGGLAQAAAFFAGFFPDEWLRFLNERANEGVNRVGRRRRPTRRSAIPVNDLDGLTGLDLYDRARLAEEGVDSVHALARPDLISLLMHTRIPAVRLLDWVDQAVLQLYAGPPCPHDPDDDGRPTMARRLRGSGIRTATDVLALRRPPADLRADRDARAAWRRLVRVLREDPTVETVRNWRTTCLEVRPVVVVDAARDEVGPATRRPGWPMWFTPSGNGMQPSS